MVVVRNTASQVLDYFHCFWVISEPIQELSLIVKNEAFFDQIDQKIKRPPVAPTFFAIIDSN